MAAGRLLSPQGFQAYQTSDGRWRWKAWHQPADMSKPQVSTGTAPTPREAAERARHAWEGLRDVAGA